VRTSPRIPRRRLAPPLAAIGAAIVAFSCGGSGSTGDSCASTATSPTSPTEPVPLTVLAPRYVLESVGGQPLPGPLRQEGTRVETIVADTITFAADAQTATAGEFGEITVVSVRNGTAEPVVTRTVAAAGTRRFSRGTSGTALVVTAFAPTSAAAPGDALPAGASRPAASLSLIDPGTGRIWLYLAR
jgi:hypothetical protein